MPDGWFCYDMCGTEGDPAAHAELVDYTGYQHSSTVIFPKLLKRATTKAGRIKAGDYFLHREEMDLEAFCKEYGLDVPDNPIKFEMRLASPDEAGLFYALPPEKDEDLGAIGHVRIDFGRNEDEFWHTWWPRGPEGLNTPEFKDELGQVVEQLRRGVLKDFFSMLRHCHISGGTCCQNYGFVVKTERYLYRLRCNPMRGDYPAYPNCFNKQAFGLTEKGRQTLSNAVAPASPTRTSGMCGKAPASREEAKTEHSGSAACNLGVSAGIPYLCPYSGKLWNSRKQYLSRNQMGGRIP